MQYLIPLTETTLDEREVEAVARVLRSGWLTMGPEVAAFEREFAEALGVRHAIAVATGTAALHLAYQAAGVQPGDEVLVPALTFAATLNAALYLGARPVLVDCTSEDDLTLSVSDLDRKITDQTRMIVTMPYGGQCPDMKAILSIASKRGIRVVEDACHAPLASIDGKRIGTFGIASTWSFFSNKNLTTGEGGMVATDDDEVAATTRLLRSHGMTAVTYERHTAKAGSYDIIDLGYNYRMDEIRAAIGREQLKKLPEANVNRSRADFLLREALHPLESRGLRIPFSKPRGIPVHHVFVILLPETTDRDGFRDQLSQDGIQTSIHYPPLDRLSYTSRIFDSPQDLPVVRRIESRLVTLPLGPSLTQEQVNQIAKAVEKAIR